MVRGCCGPRTRRWLFRERPASGTDGSKPTSGSPPTACLLCYHDSVLSRTTNGHGFVASTTFDQIATARCRLSPPTRRRLPVSGTRGSSFRPLPRWQRCFPEAGWVLDLKADGTEEPLAAAIAELGARRSGDRRQLLQRTSRTLPCGSPPGKWRRPLLPAETLRAVMASAAPRLNKAASRDASIRRPAPSRFPPPGTACRSSRPGWCRSPTRPAGWFTSGRSTASMKRRP